MKINTIVLAEVRKALRFGVITKRLAEERMTNTTVQFEVRFAAVNAETAPHRELVSEYSLREFPSDYGNHEEINAFLLVSDDLGSAKKFAAEVAEKPTEDPDDIPF